MGVDPVIHMNGPKLPEGVRMQKSVLLMEAVGARKFLYTPRFKHRGLTGEIPSFADADPFPIQWKDDEEDGGLPPHEHGGVHSVVLSTRYYGPGYERGDWPTIYAVLLWLIWNFPDREVFYGGDCDEELERVTGTLLSTIWQHFCSAKGRDYFHYSDALSSLDLRTGGPAQPKCWACAVPMHGTGGGGSVTFFSCMSCGWELHVDSEAGKPWKQGYPEDGDHFGDNLAEFDPRSL